MKLTYRALDLSSIIIKLNLCDIAFLCNVSPLKAFIVQY